MHLLRDLLGLFLLLMARILHVLGVKGIFIQQCHTNTIPGHPPVPKKCLSVLTHSRSNTIAPPAGIDRAHTLVGLKPTCGPVIWTAYRSAFFISVLLIIHHFPFLDTSASGVQTLVPWYCRSATHLLIAATTYAWWCRVLSCTIDSPLTLFF